MTKHRIGEPDVRPPNVDVRCLSADGRLRVALLALVLSAGWGGGCSPAPTPAPPPLHRQDETLQAREPISVVKIKVRRSVSGTYSWDLSGDNVKALVDADARLRQALMATSPDSDAP